MNKKAKQRFWSKVKKTKGCWLWKARGYNFRITKDIVRAQRVVWELSYGPIPDKMWIKRCCKTPNCVNPEHLVPWMTKPKAAKLPKNVAEDIKYKYRVLGLGAVPISLLLNIPVRQVSNVIFS